MLGPLKALFKSGQPDIKIIDRVWISAHRKYAACAAMVTVNPACIFICWFPETLRVLAQHVPEKNLLLARDAGSTSLKNNLVVFAEHYPLLQKETALFGLLALQEVPVLSSLDEPLFVRFGGERLLDLVQKLGMKDDEVIGSALITRALQNAQRKIGKRVTVEREAASQQEWFTHNFPK